MQFFLKLSALPAWQRSWGRGVGFSQCLGFGTRVRVKASRIIWRISTGSPVSWKLVRIHLLNYLDLLFSLGILLLLLFLTCKLYIVLYVKWIFGDFPGSPVVKNLHSSAGDTGLIPGQGTNIPYALEQLQLLSPHSLKQRTATGEAWVPQRRPSTAPPPQIVLDKSEVDSKWFLKTGFFIDSTSWDLVFMFLLSLSNVTVSLLIIISNDLSSNN